MPATRKISRNGKPYYVRVRPGHAEALGENLKEAIGLFSLLAAQKMLQDSGWDAPDVRGAEIKRAIESEPL